jgi:hypothetical protein
MSVEKGGDLLALKAWYCGSIYRYTSTDNLQPVPVRVRSETAAKSHQQRHGGIVTVS